jgi:large subunit ribosomal protein L7/L12
LQAKKFVESAPQVIKEDILKDEAENLKKAIEAVGGKCEID